MKYILSFLLFSFAVPSLAASAGEQQTLKLTVAASASPARIQFRWPADTVSRSLYIYRKSRDAVSWGAIRDSLPKTATGYTDSSVVAGTAYEYRITKSQSIYETQPTGFAYAGVNIPAAEFHGRVLIIADNRLTLYADRLSRLEADLIGEGWRVTRRMVSSTDSVPAVKRLILADCRAFRDVSALFLLGRVPVPYSGNINPDGHPDHQGAWPADVFYADTNGAWSDATVNNSTSASRAENKNIPGDGKYDQSSIPSDVDLMVGRVDFARMTQFGADTILIRKYLDKEHAFRTGACDMPRRGLVDDNFTTMGEGFSQTGWRGFSALLGADSVREVDFITTLRTQDWLCAYGCGGGSYTSCGGIGNSSDFLAGPVNGVFTALFGSYFGDWDSDNNFLRAPLAAEGKTLVCFWAGRPHWQIHHMALGEPVGFCARLSQNNSSLYPAGYGARYVHTALMGDPTLMLFPVKPATSLQITPGGPGVMLSWSASPDAVIAGYYVYRADSMGGAFVRLNASAITGTGYSVAAPAGRSVFMVRALKKENSGGGLFDNLSTGIMDSVFINGPSVEIAAAGGACALITSPNPGNGLIHIAMAAGGKGGIQRITVVDIRGQQVKAIDYTGNEQRVANLDLRKYGKGIYLLKVQGEGLTLTRALLVQ